MNAPKRKGPTTSLISNRNGKPTREVVGRASTCHHCGHQFKKGESIIVIPQREGAFKNDLRLCDGCFKPIIAQTEADVLALKAL